MLILGLVLLAGLWAGLQNALAGGGSFVTLPVLILTGLDARAANIASTLALLPGQLTTGWVGRVNATGVAGLRLRVLIGLSLVGGVIGAALLLLTPSSFFERLVPWLVLFATAVFAWGSFGRRGPTKGGVGPRGAMLIQFMIAIYGGYFGGGMSFLMLAVLTATGMAVRAAAATKNVLAGVMNVSAVAIFVFTPHVPWARVAMLAAGAVIGGYCGALLLKRIDERLIRGFVVVLGVGLTVGLFWRAAQ